MLFAALLSLFLSVSPLSFDLCNYSHLMCSEMIRRRNVSWGRVTGCQTVQCMSADECGQDFVPMDNWFRLLQISVPFTSSFAQWKTDLWGFLCCWGFLVLDLNALEFERSMGVQAVFKPTPLVLNMLLDFWPISRTLFFWATMWCKWVS